MEGVSSPTRAVFRISPLMVLFALALAVCAIPVAFGAPPVRNEWTMGG